MGKKVMVLKAFLDLDTGIAQKGENFVGTEEHENKLIDDMKDKVEDNLCLTRAFKSKEKGLQCFLVSEPLLKLPYSLYEDNNDYKINCSIEVTIVLKDDMLKGKIFEPDEPELLGEAGFKEQIIEETNAFIDELNRRSEGITVTVLDSDAYGHIPKWDYNDGKYMVAVDNDSEHRKHLLLDWKDVSLHIDHITEETLGMGLDDGPVFEDELVLKYLLKQSKEKDNVERE